MIAIDFHFYLYKLNSLKIIRKSEFKGTLLQLHIENKKRKTIQNEIS